DQHAIVVLCEGGNRVLHLRTGRLCRDGTRRCCATVVEARIRGAGRRARVAAITDKETDSKNAVGSEARKIFFRRTNRLATGRNRNTARINDLNRDPRGLLRTALNISDFYRPPEHAVYKLCAFKYGVPVTTFLLGQRT